MVDSGGYIKMAEEKQESREKRKVNKGEGQRDPPPTS